jgi:4-phytase/acid phosphatase
MRFAGLSLTMLLTIAGAAQVRADMLERVVLVSRHGVRPPTRSNEELAHYSDKPWPNWTVAPGELTPHGATALERMGEGLKLRYGRLLAGCKIAIWSDADDSRTRDSGDALARGFAPGCSGISNHGTPGTPDAIFDAVDAGLCPADPAQGEVVLRSAMETMLREQAAAYSVGRTRLQEILTGTSGACADTTAKTCRVTADVNRVRTAKGEARLEGPLNTGSSLSENLLLEYAEGMPPDQVGWGRLGKTQPEQAKSLEQVLALHNIYSDITRRNTHTASRRASLMMRQITDFLEGKASSFKGAAPVAPDKQVLLLVGHDGNLAALSGLLDKNWVLPGQPDVTAPDTIMALETWRDDKGSRTVRVKILYQTLGQLRGLSRFNARHPVPEVKLGFEECGASGCSLEQFRQRAARHLAMDCIKL